MRAALSIPNICRCESKSRLGDSPFSHPISRRFLSTHAAKANTKPRKRFVRFCGCQTGFSAFFGGTFLTTRVAQRPPSATWPLVEDPLRRSPSDLRPNSICRAGKRQQTPAVFHFPRHFAAIPTPPQRRAATPSSPQFTRRGGCLPLFPGPCSLLPKPPTATISRPQTKELPHE